MNLWQQQNIFVLWVTSKTPRDSFWGSDEEKLCVYAQRLSLNTGRFVLMKRLDLVEHIFKAAPGDSRAVCDVARAHL